VRLLVMKSSCVSPWYKKPIKYTFIKSYLSTELSKIFMQFPWMEIIPSINRLMAQFQTVVATQDWHPDDHSSFASWPKHCVQYTRGAELSSAIDLKRIEFIARKGIRAEADSYSGFCDDAGNQTGLESYLRYKQITELFVTGVATDFCVKATVLDALKLGFKVNVCSDGIAAVNLHPGDGQQALDEMESRGAVILRPV